MNKKGRKTEFEFQGNPQPYMEHIRAEEIVDGEPVTRTASPDAVSAQPTRPSMQVDNTRVSLETTEGFAYSLRGLFERIAAEWRQAKLTVTLALAAGVLIGLPVLGWGVWPVEWTNSTFNELAPAHKQAVIDMATDLYAQDPMNPTVIRFVYLYPGVQDDTCTLAETAVDPAVQARRRALAFKVSGQDCLFGE